MGPRIRHRVEIRGSIAQHAAPRLLILIHGFNNSRDRARDYYDQFMAALQANFWLRTGWELGVPWGLHWPGDHPNGTASLMSYPSRPPDAREAGRLLALHLSATTKPHQRVVIVAHSLGCRVAMEAAWRIESDHPAYQGAQLEAIFLLAPAVPTSFCEPERVFGRQRASRGEFVFHSRKDRALGLAFDLGQRHYGEPGRAVGKTGAPLTRWRTATYTGLGHGDYWSASGVAEHVGRILGLAGQHRLPEMRVDARQVEATERQIAERFIQV